MTHDISNLEPKNVFRFFNEISKIPRGSGNEEAIANYLCEFAINKNLEYKRDKFNNVLIYKKSTNPKCQTTIMLQGHMDMVCEKNMDTVHDFLKDPIDLITDGEILRANGTTLGADDGIAVAIMLAILEDDSITHCNLEFLFTTEEETGLTGMNGFDASFVKSTMLINLDSEEEGVATIACAGGCRTDITLPIERTKKAEPVIKVEIKGLAGGHSGEDINKGHASANKLIARIANAGLSAGDFYLVSINGGNKDNAIPREASFEFVSSSSYAVREKIESEIDQIKSELNECDLNFKYSISASTSSFDPMTKESSERVLSLLSELPYGVVSMSKTIENLVETSCNLGIVNTSNDKLFVTLSSRSSVSCELDKVLGNLDKIARKNYSFSSHYSRYPGWDATKGSYLQDLYSNTYKELTGKEAIKQGIHAGLECGIMSEKKTDLDIISIGPNVYKIHSPEEYLDIASTKRTYELILKMLEKLA